MVSGTVSAGRGGGIGHLPRSTRRIASACALIFASFVGSLACLFERQRLRELMLHSRSQVEGGHMTYEEYLKHADECDRLAVAAQLPSNRHSLRWASSVQGATS
jgi:hypothetical protein